MGSPRLPWIHLDGIIGTDQAMANLTLATATATATSLCPILELLKADVASEFVRLLPTSSILSLLATSRVFHEPLTDFVEQLSFSFKITSSILPSLTTPMACALAMELVVRDWQDWRLRMRDMAMLLISYKRLCSRAFTIGSRCLSLSVF